MNCKNCIYWRLKDVQPELRVRSCHNGRFRNLGDGVTGKAPNGGLAMWASAESDKPVNSLRAHFETHESFGCVNYETIDDRFVTDPSNPQQAFLQLTWEEVEPALRLVLTALDIANHQGKAYAAIVREHGLPAYADRLQRELPQLKTLEPRLEAAYQQFCAMIANADKGKDNE